MREYAEFTDRVEQAGLYPLSENPWGLPSLGSDTQESQWHTGMQQDDPWQWKNRIAADGLAYYGHVPGGRLCFIAKRLLPLFFAAYRPKRDIEERYQEGLVEQRALSIARAFRRTPCMPSYQLRLEIGAVAGEKGKIDGAVQRLEKEMFLCIGAMTHKKNKKGEPYGWGVNEFWLCEAFFPKEIDIAAGMDTDTARRKIEALVTELGGDPAAERLFPKQGA